MLQSFLGFGSSAEIAIELADGDKRKKVDVKNEEGKKEKLPLYLDGESVSGKVRREGRRREEGRVQRECGEHFPARYCFVNTTDLPAFLAAIGVCPIHIQWNLR